MKRSELRNPEKVAYIRDRLAVLMEERKLIPAVLASMAMIPLSSVTRILDGTTKNPSADVLLSLAEALGVTVSELTGEFMVEEGCTTLYVEGRDRPGLLRDITTVIANFGINIVSSLTGRRHGQARCVLQVEIDDGRVLEQIVRGIESIWLCESVRTDVRPATLAAADRFRKWRA